MCKFLSIITKGDGIPLFINLEERKKDPYNKNFDSHSHIAEKFIKESELKNFDNLKGKCDVVNSYEVDFNFDDDYKITNYNIIKDKIRVGDDLELLKNNIDNLLPEFNEIVKYHFWDRFVENPKIEGSLDLSNTQITKLPDKLEVGGYLYLSNIPITELPNNLKVGGDLYLSYTQITKLPDNLKVDGNLNLSNTPITKLPDNLKVDGDLDLHDAQITELPDNLKVDGDLDLSFTNITELPDNLKVGRNLDLSFTNITELPDNLKVDGDLDLRHTKITKLPDKLEVGGDLYLNKSNFNQETFVKPVGVKGQQIIK